MKSIAFYDANIFRSMNIEEIKLYLEKYDNYITDDVVKELLEAKQNSINKAQRERLNLVFNEKNGLNDDSTLVLSHTPIGLGDTYENTKNRFEAKLNSLFCSTHHYWLRRIVSPALITDPLRHINSELTWRLKNGDIKYSNQIANFKNKLRAKVIKKIEPIFDQSSFKASKIIYPWAKRDTDINAGKYKISDGRLVMHAFNMMLYKECDINLLTADYDFIDLTANLIASLVDEYVINEVLTEYCREIDLDTGKRTTIYVTKSLFYETHKKVLQEIDNSIECLRYNILFKDCNGKIVVQERKIPKWLLYFALNYKGNMRCWNLGEKEYNKYPIQYIWYSDWRNDVSTIKFEVWKKGKIEIGKTEHPRCMLFCNLELEEINHPKDIATFIRPEKE